MSDNTNIDPHAALTSLWPSDTKESKRLAEEKQIKRQNLITLGGQLKQAREELGYNISDLDEHTGLSYTELEAVEQGSFNQIEQQDYVDYYVHTYASLLGLDADEILADFQQNFHQPEIVETAPAFDITDEDQYEDAFADEAKKTLEALEASGVNVLQAVEPSDPSLENPEQDTQNTADLGNLQDPHFYEQQAAAQQSLDAQPSDPQISPDGAPAQNEAVSQDNQASHYHGGNIGIGDLQATHEHQNVEPVTQSTPFPWVRLSVSFAFVLFAAFAIYLINNQFNSDKPNNTELASLNGNGTTNSNKDTDRVPDGQKAKKVGELESKIIAKGADDLSSPTAEMVQKPLVLISPETIQQTTEKTADKVQDSINNILSQGGNAVTDAVTDTISEAAKKTAEQVANAADKVNDDLAKAAELAKAAAATQQAATEQAEKLAEDAAAATALPEDSTAQLPENPVQEALSQLPSDTNKYTLHATKNSWVLIEDDSTKILFSDELTPEKIFTLPKIKGVIISLADAGVIEVYKGKTLVATLGAPDESLDLVSLEQRINQISN